MQAQPQKEHEWLQKLVGEWTCEGEGTMGPDKPARVAELFTEVVPWIVSQFEEWERGP